MARGRSAPRSAAAAAPRARPAAAPSSPPPRQPAPQPAYSSQPSAPPPMHSAPAPPPAMPSSGGGGLMSGLMGSVVTGMAMGTGSAVAHRAVDSMMGPRETRVVHEHAEAPAPAAPMAVAGGGDRCGEFVRAFTDCMNRSSNDINACEFYLNQMKECQRA